MRHLPALLLTLSLIATGCSGTGETGPTDDTVDGGPSAPASPRETAPVPSEPPTSEPDAALLAYPAEIPADGVDVAATLPRGQVQPNGVVVDVDGGTVHAFPLAGQEGAVDGLDVFDGQWRTKDDVGYAVLAAGPGGDDGGFVTDNEPAVDPVDYAVLDGDGTSHVWTTDAASGYRLLGPVPTGHLVFVREYSIAPDGTEVPLSSTPGSEGIFCDFGFMAHGQTGFEAVVSTPPDAVCLDPTLISPQFEATAVAAELVTGPDRSDVRVTTEGIIGADEVPQPQPQPFEFGFFQPVSGLVDGVEVWAYEGADRGLLHDPTTDRMILGLDDGTIAAFDGASTATPTELWVAGPFCEQVGEVESGGSGVKRMRLGEDGHLYAELRCGDDRGATLDLVPSG